MQHEIRNSRYWLDAGSRKMVSVQLHEEGAPPNQSEKKGFPLKMRLDLGLPIGASHDAVELDLRIFPKGETSVCNTSRFLSRGA